MKIENIESSEIKIFQLLNLSYHPLTCFEEDLADIEPKRLSSSSSNKELIFDLDDGTRLLAVLKKITMPWEY